LNCPHCQTLNDDSATVCAACGARLCESPVQPPEPAWRSLIATLWANKGALATIAAGLLLVLLSRIFPPLGGLITSLITLFSSSSRSTETDLSDPWASYCMGAILVVIGCGWLAVVLADEYLGGKKA
jgi:hypothetical protein